jgi:hypothetical protein
MAAVQKEAIKLPKPKVERCHSICAYWAGGNEGKQCKNKCSRESGHILNCKCRSHELQ